MTPPTLVDTPALVDACVQAISAGQGALAVDTERAGSYRYYQGAFLIQISRQDAGTWLLDPVNVDVTAFTPVVNSIPWTIHAATQDLPWLQEWGWQPSTLFDTELAGRLLGHPKVGLATMLETYLGIEVEKKHSAADWSQRPLPRGLLRYAADDVDYLNELATQMLQDLHAAGKYPWAQQEFDFLLTQPAPTTPSQPWRRIKGAHLRTWEDHCVAEELWRVRDTLAREHDLAPHRVLHDRTLSILVNDKRLTAVTHRRKDDFLYSHRQLWERAIDAGKDRAARTPEPRSTQEIPHHRVWKKHYPAAAELLATTREGLLAISEEVTVPVENLLLPGTHRSIVWDIAVEGHPATHDDIVALLTHKQVRPWQVELVTETFVTSA